MKRVILGLGAAPGTPQDLRCKQAACGSALVTWQPPATLGHPPFHKYKLQRSRDGGVAWVTANRLLDPEDTSWLDEELEVRKPEDAKMLHCQDSAVGFQTQRKQPATGCARVAWQPSLNLA